MRRIITFIILLLIISGYSLIPNPLTVAGTDDTNDLDKGTVVRLVNDIIIEACDESETPIGVIYSVETVDNFPDIYEVVNSEVAAYLVLGLPASYGDEVVPYDGGLIQPLDSADGCIVGTAIQSGVAGDSILVMININCYHDTTGGGFADTALFAFNVPCDSISDCKVDSAVYADSAAYADSAGCCLDSATIAGWFGVSLWEIDLNGDLQPSNTAVPNDMYWELDINNDIQPRN